jgi:glycosyltransferase involved in cell wall biosynthesis
MKNGVFLGKSINGAFFNPALPMHYTPDAASKLAAPERQPEILFLSTYPPRECGIATYSQDLIRSLKNKFHDSFKLSICAVESAHEKHIYSDTVKYILDTDDSHSFVQLVKDINKDRDISMVLIQHEFGLFANNEQAFLLMLQALTKPVGIVFHTVLPNPDAVFRLKVEEIAATADALIVMTQTSCDILIAAYNIPAQKISVIPHGTHLVRHTSKTALKEKYQFENRKVLSTFGLLSAGKSIETTLDALPSIVSEHPDVLFLILGKTHPGILKQEGEQYRESLEQKVKELGLQHHVHFVNRFLSLPELLEYLQLTDVYLFTSKDPNQAVSGTFSYAMSCGCPIVSTPIPHAIEVLRNNAGITIGFGSSPELSAAVNSLLGDDQRRTSFSLNAIHNMSATSWENSALAHARLFRTLSSKPVSLHYRLPHINLHHLKEMTTDFGIIQFARINQPDEQSGYTLDDNARALIAFGQHYTLTGDEGDIPYIRRYLDFIGHCLQEDGSLLNYVDMQQRFTEENGLHNLEDATGRAIWALGYLLSISDQLPADMGTQANVLMEKLLKNAHKIYSTRAMAFIIKGIYYRNTKMNIVEDHFLIRELANRMIQMYRHENDAGWHWFEQYMTYANSILPEALLCAWMTTGKPVYKQIAKSSFDFLLSRIFTPDNISVVSNKGWLHKGHRNIPLVRGGEQPIDVAYTIMALEKFYEAFKDNGYLEKMELAFSWFLGNNHLNQIIYNPCTGGCYDGLEEKYINLNQGAESTVSYLLARLTIETVNNRKKLQRRESMFNEFNRKN